MKGVIVQAGEPKSIVLFNNGKIGAIPTPADCHVGMVVTVKLNSTLKIVVGSLAAVLLVALGVMIGANFLGGAPGRSLPLLPLPPGPGVTDNSVRERMGMGMGMGAGRRMQGVSVAEAIALGDDAQVLLTGNIVEVLDDEKYLFRDSSGEIIVEIERKLCRGMSMNPSNTVELGGEVDVDHGRTVIDVKTLRIR